MTSDIDSTSSESLALRFDRCEWSITSRESERRRDEEVVWMIEFERVSYPIKRFLLIQLRLISVNPILDN